MNIKDFESIKKKIDIGKEKRAKASGAIENILASWKKQYDIESIENAEERLANLQAEYDKNNAKIDMWYEELKGLTNWALM